jgi:hypothetical protein
MQHHQTEKRGHAATHHLAWHVSESFVQVPHLVILLASVITLRL